MQRTLSPHLGVKNNSYRTRKYMIQDPRTHKKISQNKKPPLNCSSAGKKGQPCQQFRVGEVTQQCIYCFFFFDATTRVSTNKTYQDGVLLTTSFRLRCRLPLPTSLRLIVRRTRMPCCRFRLWFGLLPRPRTHRRSRVLLAVHAEPLSFGHRSQRRIQASQMVWCVALSCLRQL